MWLIEENATIRLRSRWASETIEPHTMEAKATTKRSGWTSWNPDGRMNTAHRISP